jgi:hypothetical protein
VRPLHAVGDGEGGLVLVGGFLPGLAESQRPRPFDENLSRIHTSGNYCQKWGTRFTCFGCTLLAVGLPNLEISRNMAE